MYLSKVNNEQSIMHVQISTDLPLMPMKNRTCFDKNQNTITSFRVAHQLISIIIVVFYQPVKTRLPSTPKMTLIIIVRDIHTDIKLLINS